jgi:hypothetical protein
MTSDLNHQNYLDIQYLDRFALRILMVEEDNNVFEVVSRSLREHEAAHIICIINRQGNSRLHKYTRDDSRKQYSYYYHHFVPMSICETTVVTRRTRNVLDPWEVQFQDSKNRCPITDTLCPYKISRTNSDTYLCDYRQLDQGVYIVRCLDTDSLSSVITRKIPLYMTPSLAVFIPPSIDKLNFICNLSSIKVTTKTGKQTLLCLHQYMKAQNCQMRKAQIDRHFTQKGLFSQIRVLIEQGAVIENTNTYVISPRGKLWVQIIKTDQDMLHNC